MKNNVLLLWISVFVTQFFYANAENSSDSDFYIHLEEIGHMLEKSQEDSYIIYNLITKGFPKYTELDLVLSSSNASNIKYGLYSLFIDDRGQSMNIQSFENGDPVGCTPFYLVIKNPAYGEQIDCSLTIMGRTLGTQTRIIPFPVESRFANQRVSLSVINSEERIYNMKGTGFKPYKKITIDLFDIWKGNDKRFETFADDNGDFLVQDLNFPGNFQIKITDESGCKICIDYFDKYPSYKNWYDKHEEKVNYSVSLKKIHEKPLYAIQGAGFEPNQLVTVYIEKWCAHGEQYEIYAEEDGTFFEYLPGLDDDHLYISVVCEGKYVPCSDDIMKREHIKLLKPSSK